MLNILFGFFLFGLMCALSAKGLYRAYNNQGSFSTKDYALLLALFIGTLTAFYCGMNSLGY